jgi:hypothetical protein
MTVPLLVVLIVTDIYTTRCSIGLLTLLRRSPDRLPVYKGSINLLSFPSLLVKSVIS